MKHEEDKANVAFGARLRELRLLARMGQAELGGLAGLSACTIAMVERGETDLRWTTALRILKALGVRLRAFEAGSTEKPRARGTALVENVRTGEGLLLYRWRKDRKLTLAEAAGLMGWSRQYWAQQEERETLTESVRAKLERAGVLSGPARTAPSAAASSG